LSGLPRVVASLIQMARRLLHFLLVLLGVATAGNLLACRYSVRDTGFIDLGNSPYRLELSAAPDFPVATRRAWEQAAAAVLLDSNLSFAAGPDLRPGEPATLRLVGPDDRSLLVGEVPADPSVAANRLEAIVRSPARDQLYRESLRAYGVVLLIAGTDPAATSQAQAAAEAAIAKVARLIPGMPKPVDVPPQLVVLPVAAQAAEAIFLWGLGLDPAPSRDPRLALLYGRGRRLGSALEGPLITETVLRERLVLIGQDCECDLDRGWLRGPLAPGRWDRALQVAAAQALGFDPENPVVRAEVSRIVERGPQPGQRRRTGGTAQALGYHEESVESLPEPTDLAEPSPQTTPTAPALASGNPRLPTMAQQVPPGGLVPPGPVPQPITPTPPPARLNLRLWMFVGGLATTVVVLGAWFGFRGFRGNRDTHYR
jgi:hypothetical protein